MQNVAPLFIKPDSGHEEPQTADKSGRALADALGVFEQWRSNKKSETDPVPDDLWRRIFSLEAFFPGVQLRRFFSLSKRQYVNNREKLIQGAAIKPATDGQKAPAAPPELCRVNIKNEGPYAIEPLPSAKTMVVEFRRHDGQIMKIHTTQDSITELMRQFLGE